MTGEIEQLPIAGKLACEPLVLREKSVARATNRVVGLLHEALEASGLSQRDLAAALDVSEGRVSQVVGGDGNVYLSTLARYLRAMGYELLVQAEATSHDLPEIGSRRRRRDLARSGTDRSDVYLAAVSHNGATHVQVVLTEAGVPMLSAPITAHRKVGYIEHGDRPQVFRTDIRHKLEA